MIKEGNDIGRNDFWESFEKVKKLVTEDKPLLKSDFENLYNAAVYDNVDWFYSLFYKFIKEHGVKSREKIWELLQIVTRDFFYKTKKDGELTKEKWHDLIMREEKIPRLLPINYRHGKFGHQEVIKMKKKIDKLIGCREE